MGINDKLAMKALLKGKSSGEFKKAADSKGNTACFLLAMTLALSYFSESNWYLLTLVLLVVSVFQSISATLIAERLKTANKLAISKNYGECN
jgi:hypothetical protein